MYLFIKKIDYILLNNCLNISLNTKRFIIYLLYIYYIFIIYLLYIIYNKLVDNIIIDPLFNL